MVFHFQQVFKSSQYGISFLGGFQVILVWYFISRRFSSLLSMVFHFQEVFKSSQYGSSFLRGLSSSNLIKKRYKIKARILITYVQASKGNVSQCYYSLPEFQEWKDGTENWHTYKIKYYKGFYFKLAYLQHKILQRFLF